MKLVLTLADGEIIEHEMTKGSITIGRSNRCDLVISHEAMSRQHCRIDEKDGEVFITDLGSINGVLIDGQRIPPNKAVSFYNYLNVSFGFVQSAQFFVDEPVAPLQEKSRTDRSGIYTNKTSQLKSGNEQKTISKINSPKGAIAYKAPTKSKSALSKIPIRLIAFILSLIGLYWFLYHGKEPAKTDINAPEEGAVEIKTIDQF